MHVKLGLGTEAGTEILSLSEHSAEKNIDPREMKKYENKKAQKNAFHLYTWYCYINKNNTILN
jgi:zona occludens toxin (predicted ATPase)